MNVEYINPFLEATKKVFITAANIEVKISKPFLKVPPIPSDAVAIVVGLTGELRGQVIISINIDVAMKIASSMMMGMPVDSFDDMAKSAISELANMILGNTATFFYQKGIAIDITPPTILQGANMLISTAKTKTLCIPIDLSIGGHLEMNVSLAE